MLVPPDAAASGLRCGRRLSAAGGGAAGRARGWLQDGQRGGGLLCMHWMLLLQHRLRLLLLQCLLLLWQELLHLALLERNLLLLAQHLGQRSCRSQLLLRRWLLRGRLLQELLLTDRLLLRGRRRALGGRRARRKELRGKLLLLRRLLHRRLRCAGGRLHQRDLGWGLRLARAGRTGWAVLELELGL